jgi:hypothetical protein
MHLPTGFARPGTTFDTGHYRYTVGTRHCFTKPAAPRWQSQKFLPWWPLPAWCRLLAPSSQLQAREPSLGLGIVVHTACRRRDLVP